MSPSDLHPTPVASEAPLDPREYSVEIPVVRVLQSRVTGALRPENSLGSKGGWGRERSWSVSGYTVSLFMHLFLQALISHFFTLSLVAL